MLISAAEGNGPVNALDLAMRKDLGKYQDRIADLELVDFKVRIIDGGTGAVTRVLVSRDGTGIDVHDRGQLNIIDASFEALYESLTYKLMKTEAAPAPSEQGAAASAFGDCLGTACFQPHRPDLRNRRGDAGRRDRRPRRSLRGRMHVERRGLGACQGQDRRVTGTQATIPRRRKPRRRPPIARCHGRPAAAAAGPALGLVSAQPDGSLVIAGTGTPGEAVTVCGNGAPLGTVTAETGGDWA